jgi:MED7 protein
MLQESNKFREHQAREILIDLLEKQLEQRGKILQNLRHQVSLADDLLRDIDEPLET